jgi:hypothetical protein
MSHKTFGHLLGQPHDPARTITEHDLLSWEIQFKREGTLPPETQRRMLEHLAERPVAI